MARMACELHFRPNQAKIIYHLLYQYLWIFIVYHHLQYQICPLQDAPTKVSF